MADPPSPGAEYPRPSTEPDPGLAPGRRRRVTLAAVTVIALAGVAAVGVTVIGGNDGNDGGDASSSGCLSGLAEQAPPDEGVVQGTDLVRARAAGMDDSGGLADRETADDAGGAAADWS